MESDAAVLALPDDVLTAILRRLPTQSLTTSRCVCKAWRDVVDESGILQRIRRILPHSVSGIFTNYVYHDMLHFFARPTSAAAAGTVVDGNFSYVPERHHDGWYKVVDHCNGLVLYHCENYVGELYMCNPTTRRCARLPQLAVLAVSRRRAFLAFSPAVSQHYKVLVAPVELASEEEQRLLSLQDAPAPPAGDMEWPPLRWRWHVFSSRTGRWQERTGSLFHHNGPWILDDYYKYKKDSRKLDWSSDGEDDIICSNANGEEEEEDNDDDYIYLESIDFLGFHPYKEVIFLAAESDAFAYHLNTSKVQFLGKLSPARWNCGLYDSFVYTSFPGLPHRG